MSIEKTIAQAIRKADKSYFWENYTKQARSVLKALEKAGYVVAPITPSKEMVKAGSDAIIGGKVKPSTHVTDIYQVMISAVEVE